MTAVAGDLPAAPDTEGLTVVSYSELDAFKQCPHKHQLAYVERWSKAKADSSATGRGNMWHALMEAHYEALKVGDSPREAVGEVVRSYRDAGRDPDTVDLLEWMYEGYVEKWGNDREWRVLATEYRRVVPLPFPDGSPSGIALKVIIDLVIQHVNTGKLWLVDHKSHADLPKSKELELDDQFGLYTWALRQVGQKVFGSIYNTARTKRNKVKPQTLDERFDRYFMTRTDRELDTIAHEALRTAMTSRSESNFGERHTNTDTCRWRCDYTEACLLGRKTGPRRERQFLLDTGFTRYEKRH